MTATLEPKASVCLCTFRRPDLLAETLQSLIEQAPGFGFEIIVVDNDANRTAEETVQSLAEAATRRRVPLRYHVEPEQNIALARNRSVADARGEYVAFIDDDECADPNWLESLVRVLESEAVDGVFGPVLSIYPETFPAWIAAAELLPRARFASGTRMPGAEGRSGNALLRRSALALREGPFDRAYGLTGGSDTDLLGFLDRQGCTFAWADEAIVRERQDEKRADPKWYLVRAYRSGWTRMKTAIEASGSLVGTSTVLLRILPSLAYLTAQAVRSVSNPRAMLLLMAMAIAGQAGKIGYLFGWKVEEYRTNPRAAG